MKVKEKDKQFIRMLLPVNIYSGINQLNVLLFDFTIIPVNFNALLNTELYRHKVTIILSVKIGGDLLIQSRTFKQLDLTKFLE